MSICQKLYVLAALFFLHANCLGEEQQKQNTDTLYALGVSAYNLWKNHLSLFQLRKAQHHFAQALKQQPHNINIQKAHYNALLMLCMLTEQQNSPKLERHFERLHPMVKEEVTAPAKLHYVKAEEVQADLDTRLQTLMSAIRQQPKDAHSWFKLSEVYEQKQIYWLAAVTASKAIQLDKNNHEYFFQAGDSINDIIQTRSCWSEQRVLSKRAIEYMTKAAKLNPNEQLYFDNIALQYLRLGLTPLAYHQVKKAYALEQNEYTGAHYAEIALLLKKYEEAKAAAKTLLNVDRARAHSIEALIAMSEGRVDAAKQHLSMQMQLEGGDLFQALTSHWILQITGAPKPYTHALAEIATLAKTPWEKRIVKFVAQNSSQPEETLIQHARNNCEKTEAHFYTAMKRWLEGELMSTQQHLRAVSALGNVHFIEHLWARALLESGILSENVVSLTR